jgi:hypothetical protein
MDGDLNRSPRWDRASADLGNAAEDRGIEITRATFIANADGHIFQNDKASLVPQGLAVHSPLTYGAITVFAIKIIHARYLTIFRKL